MKCPECDQRMEVDIDNQRYFCICGREIKWGSDLDNGIPNY